MYRDCYHLLLFTVWCVFVSGICPDGVKEVGEECDDGNLYSYDGCSRTCIIEDPSESTWLCTTLDNVTSSCCPVLVHPVTLAKTCTCTDHASYNTLGFEVTPNCFKRDIDECNVAGVCHAKATCINYDASVDNPMGTFTCACPTGWIGDGFSNCDVHSYTTKFKVGQLGVESVVSGTVIANLQGGGVIPSSISLAAITTDASPYFGTPDQRRARVTGVEIIITILSENTTVMDAVTQSINMTALPSEYIALGGALSSVLVGGQGLINTLLSGFAVDSVVFSSEKNTWEIDCRYVSAIPNTITSPFVSKIGAAPYSVAATNTYEISKFPCQSDVPSVCCLLNYRDSYTVGGFSQNITDVVGVCDSTVQATDTLNMFDVQRTQSLITGLLDAFNRSSVLLLSDDTFRLSLSTIDIDNHFSKRVDYDDGHYELKFFLGMAYLTVLPAPVIATAASQVQITVSISPTLTFAFSSQQDASFLQYLIMVVYQNKWIDSNLVSHTMQFVSMSLVLPIGFLQNMATGLVPLNSIRFAIAQTMPDKSDPSLWFNPCYSADSTGMYDDGSTWEAQYLDSSAQECAFSKQMCTNPSVPALRLANFYFPIGDNTITPAMQSASTYHLFVTFEVSMIDSTGDVAVTNVFTEAPITL
jgi:cysteine-rich repeat protein